MSYDISYYTKESYNSPDNRELVIVAPFMAEGGTVRAEIIGDKLIPATITECDINITYNYSQFYYKHIDSELGIRWIYGKTGTEVKERIEKAILILGIQRNTAPFLQINSEYTIGQIFDKKPIPVSDEKHAEYKKVQDWDTHPDKKYLFEIGYLKDGGSYWKPTPGNAGYALMRILTWIIQEPNGIFGGD
jgi:hypothetical protein